MAHAKLEAPHPGTWLKQKFSGHATQCLVIIAFASEKQEPVQAHYDNEKLLNI